MAKALSRYQEQVASAIALGLSNREVAERLGSRPHGVRSTVRFIFLKLGVTSRLELALNWNCELYQIGLKEGGWLR